MGKKLSKVQREVLEYMAQGHRLYASRNGSWLNGVPGERGLYKRVHGNTLYSLYTHGYISNVNTASTPWWRGDYEITDKGRDILNDEGELT